MSTRVQVRVLDPSHYEAWDRFVCAAPAGSPYATAEYLDVLCAATGAGFRVVAAFRGEELAGGVALYEVRGRFGLSVMPRLLLYYNGLVLAPSETRYPSVATSREVETLSGLEGWLRAAGHARLTLRSRSPVRDVRPFLDGGWTAAPAYSYVVPLDDLAAQWERVEPNLRRLVRRGERDGLALSDDTDFETFFRLHEGTHARKGTALYLPREAFEGWFRKLHGTGRCHLYHARLPDGRSVAAQLVLTGGHPISHTVSAGADPEFLHTGANAFLRWKSFEALAALGYAGNDLTDAGLGRVTHFKSQLGGTLDGSVLLSRPEAALLRLVDGVRAGLGRLRGLR